MSRKILKAVGYSLFFLVAVLFFMYWTFPMDKVRHWVEQQAMEKWKLDVSIAEMDLAGLNGVEAGDIVLRLRAKKEEAPTSPAASAGEGAPVEAAAAAAPKDKKPAWRTVRIDKLEAHVGLWDILFSKRIDVRADLEALGGNVEGVHVVSDEERKRWKVTVDKLDGLRLALLPLEDWLGADLKGTLSGTISAEVEKDMFESRGVATLEIAGLKMPSPSIDTTLYGQTQTFVLSDVDFGAVKLDLTLDKKGNIPALGAKSGDRSTVLHFATVQADGGDLALGFDERSTLTLSKGQPLKTAYMNLHGSFQIAPTFFEREVVTDGEKEKPNLFLRTLLQGDRKWRAAERDGVYGFRCVGPLSPKSCTPTKPPGRGRYTPSARKAATGREAPSKPAPPEARGKRAPTSPVEGDEPIGRDEGDEGDAGRRIRMIGDRERERPGFIRDRKLPRGLERDRGRGDDEDEQKIQPVELPDHPQPGDMVPSDEPDEPADGELVPEDELAPEEPVDEPVDEGVVPEDELPPEDGEPVEEGAVDDGEAPPEEGYAPPDDGYVPY